MDWNATKQNKVPPAEKNKIQRKGLIYGIAFMIVIIALLSLYYTYTHTRVDAQLMQEQLVELDTMEASIQNNMQIAASPLLIFNRSETAKEILVKDNESRREIFNDIFLSLTKEIGIYQQIRLIDNFGMEIVRVDNHSNGTYEIVDKAKLQDKSNRYYFKETMKVSEDTIYISPFDLNMERGQIEIPYKPMIRLGKSYRTSDGNINGMMILNVNGKIILDDIAQLNSHTNDSVFLLNRDGYYLHSEETDKNFAFMFPDKQDVGFFNDFKNEWELILQGEEIIITDEGHFYIKEISLLDPMYYRSSPNEFYLVMYVPESEVHRADGELNKSVLISGVFLIPLSLLLGWSFGITRARNIFYKKQLEENASRDSLTGLYNHRMIIHLLNQMIGLSKRKDEQLSIVFIDVNNLKKVNDQFGHKMGDKMLIAAADSLKDSARTTDLVARLGGDEFLIVLPNCSLDNAAEITKRASETFLSVGIEEMNMPWSMSFGCALLEESETIYEFINRADKLMYENKKKYKLEQSKQK